MYLANCLITEVEKQPGLVQISGVCPSCQEMWHLTLLKDKVLRYMEGKELIQNIFPDLSKDMRELLQSGICNLCWKRMFGNDEAEDSKTSDSV